MKIFLTGSSGMLGSSLVSLLKSRNHTVLSSNISQVGNSNYVGVDVRDFDQVQQSINDFKPQTVMHLAAETDVDVCEQDFMHAFKTNVLGTQNVALVCKKYRIPVLYMSSAEVFDGKKKSPYIESDEPRPINIYGVTKLEGEKLIRSLVPSHFIVRAGWMFGGDPKKDGKFVGKIIEQIKQGKNMLTVVNDKISTPTYIPALSDHLERLIRTEFWGTYHCCCKGVCTRVEVTREIIQCFNLVGKISINEVSSTDYPLHAPRPDSGCLENLMLKLRGMDHMPHWQSCLEEYLKLLL